MPYRPRIDAPIAEGGGPGPDPGDIDRVVRPMLAAALASEDDG